MPRPLLLIHGYSATGLDLNPLKQKLVDKGIAAELLNVGNYISLNNELTIRDIAEGLERAIELVPSLSGAEEFDAIVHSTGMLVVRAWLAHQRAAVNANKRLARLKHLIGVAPATWGSPQASKGRTWLGALVKGDKTPGPDFMNAGDKILDGLELGSRFTWDLAHLDLLGDQPYFGTGADTPYVTVFIGNTPYEGLKSVANDPGTDGTVRWSGCGLNTRKITLDLTRTPLGPDGTPTPSRVTMSDWATDQRLDIPILAVEGRNHASLVGDPDQGMVDRIRTFLDIDAPEKFTAWLTEAKTWAEPARQKMLINPGDHAPGLVGTVKQYFGQLFHLSGQPLEGWQQFVIHARDEHGDPVSDYMLEVFRWEGEPGAESWQACEEMYTDVHAYKTDASFRCIHVRLPAGLSESKAPMQIRIQASTGTEVVTYQGYGSPAAGGAAAVRPLAQAQAMRADSDPVVFDISAGLGTSSGSLFHPFTTTLVEIILNRVPYPFGEFSQVFKWL